MGWFKREARPGELQFYAADIERYLREVGLSPFAKEQQIETRPEKARRR